MKSIRPSLVAMLALLLLVPGLVYFSLRLALPGDASIPMVDFQWIQSGELAVRPVSPVPQGLQAGDLVTAIQGREIDRYIQGMLSPQEPTGGADRIQYTVRRGGQMLQVDFPLTAISLSQVVNHNWTIFIYLIYLELVSLVVFILRPRQSAAQLFFVVSSVLLSSGLIFFLGLRINDLLYGWLVFLYIGGAVVLYGFLLAALVHMALVFPKTHPLLIRHPGWLWLIYLGVWLPFIAYIAARWLTIGSPAAHLALVVQGTALMSVVYYPLLLLASVSSYRTGSEREKRQLRWIMWSLMISLIPYLVFTVLPSLLGVNFQLAAPLLGILWCTVPTSFAIAVLHERLFDIDVIIRRTLIYSALTVILSAVFFISILLLQGFFQVFTGHLQSPLATVLSTLMIAALFNPLRRRIQKDIDRRFYRRKYDTEKILKEFALRLRNEVGMEKITEDLVNVVEETMQPQKPLFVDAEIENTPAVIGWKHSQWINTVRRLETLMAHNELDQKIIDQHWLDNLTTGKPGHYFGPIRFREFRKLMKLIPDNPRCKLCNVPFSGIGGKFVKLTLDKEQSTLNPSICNVCEKFAREHPGGAEVEISMLFADVRGSTTLAEKMVPSEFSRLIGRFYRVATDILVDADAWIEKLIGDEVTALFIPGYAGPHHARLAVEAAQAILQATGHSSPEGPWIPVGVGVHTGIAYVGTVGKGGGMIEITALGDSVNTAARLASNASTGEILVSAQTWNAAGLDIKDIETQQLQLKGRSEPVEVRVLKVISMPHHDK